MSSEQVQTVASGSGADDIAVKVENLSKCYHIYPGNRARLRQAFFPKKKYYEEFWALKDIGFEIRRGEAMGVIGLNGAGKSTLLQILAGILQPTSGVVEVAGRISALIELGAGFDPLYTGRENVYMNGAIMGLSRKYVDGKMKEIRDFADIGDFFDRPIWMYSSGMYMRLAFAVATALEPEILIIDEVLAVGDLAFRRKCYDRISELRERNVTILFVSHDLTDVENVCSRAILLENGRVVKTGRSSAVVHHYQKAFGTGGFVPGESILKDYYKLLDEQKESLSERELHEFQTGEVEFRKIEILNGQNEPCTSFRCSDRMKIRIEYFAKHKIENPILSVSFYNSKGIHCYGNRSFMGGVSAEDIVVDEIEGEGTLEADFGKIRLNSDTYMLGVAIFDPLFSIPYAFSRSLKIQVAADSWNSNVGIQSPILIANVNWRFS